MRNYSIVISNILINCNKKSAVKSGFIEFGIKKQINYKIFICFNVVWFVVILSAKPQGLEVLLQEEKHVKPIIQIATNTIFFIF
ncbi:hypothetical protein OBPA_08550 [Polaribacter sp. OB-PA-B3]